MEIVTSTAGLTDEQLESLARASSALLVRQAVEKLKRRELHTAREQAALDRALRNQRKTAPLTAAERVRKMVAMRNTITIPQQRMSERRKSCKSKPVLFLKTYLPHWFTKPFSQDQLDDIEDMRRLYMEGRNFFIVEPRGWGKTTRADGMALWAMLNGWQRYVPLVAATAKMAKKLAGDVTQEIADNDSLAEDWPDICLPIRAAYQRANRAGYVTVTVIDPETNQPVGEPCQAARMVCSTTKLVLPCVRAITDGPEIYNSVFECAGLQEACRGLWHKTSSGERLRPDVVLIDDFQTDRSAASLNQCATRINLIKSAFKRMGGPSKKVRIGIAATVIKPGDAAHQLLDRKKHPDLNGLRKRFVYEWPKASRQGMEQRGIPYDADKDLWEQYVTLRKQGHRDGDGGRVANAFYIEHREAMDEGVKVGWDYGYDESLGELTTVQSAFNIIADDGEAAFMAECQNEPLATSNVVVRLTSDAVMQRTNNLTAGEVPDMAQVVVGFVDMNDHALAWTVGAFHKENSGGVTGSITGYGEWGMDGNLAEVGRLDRLDRIWDEKHPSPEGKEQRFWKALEGCMTYLLSPGLWTRRGQMVPLNLVLIDSGYTLEKGSRLVYNWCRSWYERGGANVMPCRGWPARTFRMKNDGAVVRQSLEAWWRMEEYELRTGVKITALAHDADFHRRQMQAAWTLPPGSPQSLNIYGTQGVMHMRYAQQVACEKLTQYVQSDSPRASGLYQWDGTPGIRNEMGDTTSGCRLAAWALLGDSTMAGQTVKPPPAPAPAPSGPPPRHVNAPRVVASARPGRQRHAVVEMPGWGR